MIQRIQTVFMLLFVIAAAVNFFLFSSEIVVFEPVLGEKVDSSPYISILLAILVLVNIGFYKKRTLQVRINQLVWVLYTLFWGSFVYFTVQNTTEGLNLYLPDLLIAFVGEVALLLANRYIRKDEALIRSLDRLR